MYANILLNTNQPNPHLSKYWCIPKENVPYYAANMDDILTIYQKAYNFFIPVVCMDKNPVQLLSICVKPMENSPEIDTVI